MHLRGDAPSELPLLNAEDVSRSSVEVIVFLLAPSVVDKVKEHLGWKDVTARNPDFVGLKELQVHLVPVNVKSQVKKKKILAQLTTCICRNSIRTT